MESARGSDPLRPGLARSDRRHGQGLRRSGANRHAVLHLPALLDARSLAPRSHGRRAARAGLPPSLGVLARLVAAALADGQAGVAREARIGLGAQALPEAGAPAALEAA